jgi:hypothetical protein
VRVETVAVKLALVHSLKDLEEDISVRVPPPLSKRSCWALHGALAQSNRKESVMRTVTIVKNVIPLLVLFVSLTLSSSDAFGERAQFQWSARISASEEYQSNIDLAEDNEEDDWITLVGPGLTLTLKTEETEASLDYDVRYAAYAENDQNNTFRHSLSLSGFRGIPIAEHVTLDLDESLHISEEPIEVSEDVTSERHTRDRYYRNTAGGRINYLFGERDLLYAGFHHVLLENDDPSVEDSQRYRPMAGITYWFNIRNGLNLDYSYTRGEFEVSEDYDQHLSSAIYTRRFSPMTQANLSYSYDSLDYDGIQEDYVVHSSRLGVSHQISEHISGSVSGGGWVKDGERSDDVSGFNGNLEGTFGFERWTLTLSGVFGYRQQFFEADNLGFSEYRRGSATVSYQPLERLTTSLGAFYQWDDYGETVPEREDNTWSANSGFIYRVFDWLSASLRFAYRDKDSNIDENDYQDYRTTFTLEARHVGKPKSL